MLKNILLICLAISTFACDDEPSDIKESANESPDATLETDAEVTDASLPMQHYDFNAMEINPDQNLGLDMDD